MIMCYIHYGFDVISKAFKSIGHCFDFVGKAFKNEPPRGKTNNVVSKQIRHKPGCTSTEAG